MSTSLFNQLHPSPRNPMLQQLLDFKKTLTGDPRQIVQGMLNSGRISQSQLNQYIQQANELHRQFKGFM